MKTKYLILLSSCIFAIPSFAADICSSVSGNLIVNCGFEDGTYSSTINSATNNSVPDSWTPNYGFDTEPGFNQVTTNSYSGLYDLSIGNYDDQPVPSLSQILTDAPGGTYSGSLWVNYGGCCGDPGAYFEVLVDNTPVLTLDAANVGTGGYQHYTFGFTGTGSDVFTIEGDTNPSEWYVDSIVVTGSAAPAVPEPAELLPLGMFISAMLVIVYRHKRFRLAQ